VVVEEEESLNPLLHQQVFLVDQLVEMVVEQVETVLQVVVVALVMDFLEVTLDHHGLVAVVVALVSLVALVLQEMDGEGVALVLKHHQVMYHHLMEHQVQILVDTSLVAAVVVGATVLPTLQLHKEVLVVAVMVNNITLVPQQSPETLIPVAVVAEKTLTINLVQLLETAVLVLFSYSTMHKKNGTFRKNEFLTRGKGNYSY
jgi:hypothetical protein